MGFRLHSASYRTTGPRNSRFIGLEVCTNSAFCTQRVEHWRKKKTLLQNSHTLWKCKILALYPAVRVVLLVYLQSVLNFAFKWSGIISGTLRSPYLWWKNTPYPSERRLTAHRFNVYELAKREYPIRWEIEPRFFDQAHSLVTVLSELSGSHVYSSLWHSLGTLSVFSLNHKWSTTQAMILWIWKLVYQFKKRAWNEGVKLMCGWENLNQRRRCNRWMQKTKSC